MIAVRTMVVTKLALLPLKKRGTKKMVLHFLSCFQGPQMKYDCNSRFKLCQSAQSLERKRKVLWFIYTPSITNAIAPLPICFMKAPPQEEKLEKEFKAMIGSME